MSSLTEHHREMIENLFGMHDGYILNFSNNAFKKFMLRLTNIDIYTAPGYSEESSKAKKFRYFLSNESDALVGQTILELLEIRKIQIKRGNQDIDPYSTDVTEIEAIASEMCKAVVMPQNNQDRLNETLLSSQNVLQDLLQICACVCINKTYNFSRSEDEINDYFRDMLHCMGYKNVFDQTRHGTSASGKDAGEVDILIKEGDKEIALIEALKLDSVNQSYLKSHIDKAVGNYNALGTSTFIVAYIGTTDFRSFWNRLYRCLRDFSYPLEVRKPVEEMTYRNAAIRYANMILSKDGYDFPTYFIAVNIGYTEKNNMENKQ